MFAPLKVLSGVLVIAALLLATSTVHAQAANFEVWVVDQSDAAQGGSRLHIFPGNAVSGSQFGGQMQTVDLEAGSQGVGAGAGVRPHLLLFNSNHSHGVLAYVASGHVQVIRAADRKIVASIDVGEQAHGAVPSPDGSIILAANQNGKKLARIKADFAREQFSHDPSDDLDLKALEGADQPDNAPICPLLFTGANKAYVTLRGGGLYVVDTASTPMKVLKSFTKDQVAPAGCGGVAVGNKIFVNSGNATSGSVYVFDATSDTLTKTISTTTHGTDAHGMVLVGGGRYLWMANRGDGDNVVVVDTTTEAVVGTFAGIGAGPDLMEASPTGDRVYMTLRGPNNLTGGPPAKGETPGLAVLAVQDNGRTGSRTLFVPIGDQSPASTSDPHGIAVRRTAVPAAAPAPAAPAPAAPAAQPAAPPAQVPRALPRTGEPDRRLDAVFAVGAAALLVGLALRHRRRAASLPKT